jgi:hypothetical protein
MSGWKEFLIGILKLTDEVKRLNREVERVQDHVVAVDKRVVRLETMVEIAASTKLISKNNPGRYHRGVRVVT